MYPVIETERLVLQPMAAGDLIPLHAVLGDPETMRFYPAPLTEDQTRKWIERNIERYETDGFGLWTMVLRQNGETIGDCGIANQLVDGEVMPEIGYHVRKDLWGKGLATEAAIACRDHAFQVLNFEFVISLVRDTNLPSKRVAEKMGMTVWKETERVGWKHFVYRIAVGS